jgi:hypothetical protein
MEETKIPLPYYRDSVKKAIYKWRETHQEQYRTYASKKSLEGYYNHRDEILEKIRKTYHVKRSTDPVVVFKSFCNLAGNML